LARLSELSLLNGRFLRRSQPVNATPARNCAAWYSGQRVLQARLKGLRSSCCREAIGYILLRTEITKKLWDYIKSKKLQTRSANGKPENAGKFIVADAKLLKVFRNTNATSKSGKRTDLHNMKEGDTIDMMLMPAVVSANVE
jgi:hypothetical protein